MTGQCADGTDRLGEQLRELEQRLELTDSERVRETGRRVAGLMD